MASRKRPFRLTFVYHYNPLSIILFLLFSSFFFLSTFANAQATPGDSRCTNVVCDYSDDDIPSLSPDPALRDSRSTDPGCLSDPMYDDLKAELLVGARPRTDTLDIALPDWVSALFPTQIFQILASEILGYDVHFSYQGSGETLLCCPRTSIWMETWPGDPVPDDVGIDSLYTLPNGYVGFSAIFIPKYTLERYPLAQSYQAYQTLTEYKSIYPLAFSTLCNETMEDKEGTCTDDNRVCNVGAAEVWPDDVSTLCVDGRYVPPQCENNPTCQEIFHVTPGWDSGFFEGVIKNLGLNFTVAYLGSSPAVGDYITRAAERQEDIIFYMSGPDPVLSAVPSAQVYFPAREDWCVDAETDNPLTNGANCTYPVSILRKLIRRTDAIAQSDLKQLFDGFTISDSRLNTMMKSHYLGGGEGNIWNVSCDWVKNNVDRWKSWTTNTPLPTPVADGLNIALIAGIAAGVGAALLLLVIIGILYMRHKAKQHTKNAPTTAPLALIFTDVESSTNLWEAYPCMADAMEAHHAIIRAVIEQHECYEVKTIGDSFMIACPSMVEAMLLSLDIQNELMVYEWPEQLKYWKGDEDTQPGCWNGLRVRIGVHWCQEIEPKLDTVHGRYDYYGHDVNVSARVESVAAGGQIVLTEDSYKHMMSESDSDLLDDMVCRVFSRGVELKGVASKVAVYSATPANLTGRQFKPIAGAEAAEDETTALADPGLLRSQASIMSALSEEPQWTLAVKSILEYIPNAERQKVLSSFLTENKLMKQGESMSLAKKQQKFMKHLNQLARGELGGGVPMGANSLAANSVLQQKKSILRGGNSMSFLSSNQIPSKSISRGEIE